MDPRERVRELSAESIEKGDAVGWFDRLYTEADGNREKIPWADLEPNRFFVEFAGKTNLQGNGRTALVVGCGLGDDAVFLEELGFKVTAFDVSPKAIEWAKKLHAGKDIEFFAADLFHSPEEWNKAFDFVLEIYTIQPLPVNLRETVIDEIAKFVAENGRLVIVTRGREDDETPVQIPWPLSRKDLSRFETNGLTQTHFEEMFDDEDPPVRRFVVEYSNNGQWTMEN